MTGIGSVLEAGRLARGLSLEEAAAATRIRLHHLAALESESFSELPAPVYVRGYLRTYAVFLDLEVEALIESFERDLGRSSRNLAVRPLAGLKAPSAVVLTAPIAAAIGIVLVLAALTGYIYRELDSLRVVAPAPAPAATALPSASPLAPGAALPAASPLPRQVTVVVTATDTVWIDVLVDGKPQFGDAGKVLETGATLTFTGLQRVRLTSGKAAATLVSVNGKDLGALGNGVITREFNLQGA